MTSGITHDPGRTIALRRRVEYEDQLLNDRTTVVLQLNGLAAVAVGLQAVPQVIAVAIGVVLAVNLLWLVCAWDARALIEAMTTELQATPGTEESLPDEGFRRVVQKGRFRFGTTLFMTMILPTLLTVGWVAAALATWRALW